MNHNKGPSPPITNMREGGRFERARAAGIMRYRNGVSYSNGLVDDNRPSCGVQNRLPNRGNSNFRRQSDPD
jgi:hypothetical protein